MRRSKTDAPLIAEAAQWRLIGLLLERPRSGWHNEVATLSGEVRDRDLRRCAAAASSASEGDYLRLLGPGGLVSPREVTYQPFADPGALLAELATIYAAFGYRPHTEEPIDHIAVETGFVGYLLLKEAFAAARGDRAAVSTTASARRKFVETHLAALAGAFAQHVEHAGESYLHPIVRCLAARLPERPAPQPLMSVDPVDVCGACGELGPGATAGGVRGLTS
jgi:nitrate reductase delta subunit